VFAAVSVFGASCPGISRMAVYESKPVTDFKARMEGNKNMTRTCKED
jgi:hypothetical protein